ELQPHRHDLQLDGVTVSTRVFLVREVVAATVDHLQHVAEILLTVLTAGQVGEVRGDPRTVGRTVVLIKRSGGDAEREVGRHEWPIGCSSAGLGLAEWSTSIVPTHRDISKQSVAMHPYRIHLCLEHRATSRSSSCSTS